MVTRDKAPKRTPRKQRNTNSKGVNANQYQVDGYQLNTENSNDIDLQHIHHMPSTSVHTNIIARTSEDSDSIVEGNN